MGAHHGEVHSAVGTRRRTCGDCRPVRAMTRAELMKELEESSSALHQHKADLKKANTKVDQLREELDAITDEDEYEGNRKANERKSKTQDKKKADAKKQKKMQKTEKFSDVVMEHVAKYRAFAAAKKTANKGSKVQKVAILEAARTGGRAGAFKPLRKVARDTAVAEAKKAGTKGKHALRKISTKAARDAVSKLIKDQDELVEAAAQKCLKLAIKKHPPSVVLAEDDGKPNHFTAPPGIHLSMTGAAQEVKPIEEGTDDKKAAPKADAIVPEKH